MGSRISATNSNTSTNPSQIDSSDIWWTNAFRPTKIEKSTSTSNLLAPSDDYSLNQLQSTSNSTDLHEFSLELARKHEKRREILAAKREEFQLLRKEVEALKAENTRLKASTSGGSDNANDVIQRLREENEELSNELRRVKTEDNENLAEMKQMNMELRKDLANMQLDLQNLNKEIVDFEQEKHDYQTHVDALKDVIRVSKQLLQIRESQLKELREKVEGIEASLAGREMNILSKDLRSEYERQLENMKNLRTMYEERQRSDRREKQELNARINELTKELETCEKKNTELSERVTELEAETSKKYDEIMSLESNLGFAKAETRQYQAELMAINQLFSEVLLGFTNSQEIDLDKMTKHLEEHHELLQNIVVNEISPQMASVLPKVLLDLVTQVNQHNDCGKADDNERKLEAIAEETEASATVCQMNSAEEIVELLPKVWRVLIELLSQQKAPTNVLFSPETDEHAGDPCYKTVQTPKGPNLVLSVSQTFIRLKDLILEKKSLEKETNHLKQLNTHLESRLQDQEKRLGLVSSELSKTWHVVGKLQKQHQLLHTQEKILRYELAQKRKLLTSLKEELENSREKRKEAREKNYITEKQWKQLRTEFASRRNNSLLNDDLNNSNESGYSDERASSSDEEEEPSYEKQNAQISCETEPQYDNSALEISPVEKEEAEDVNCSFNKKEEEPINISSISSVPSTSNSEVVVATSTTNQTSFEERLAAKEERLKRLEGQCSQLVQKVTNTTNKRVEISNKLDSLHGTYGENSNSNTEDVSVPETTERDIGKDDDE